MCCQLVDQGELEPEQSLADYASTPCAPSRPNKYRHAADRAAHRTGADEL